MVLERRVNCFFLFIFALFLFGCGIEDYPFINPIPQSNVNMEMNNRATVRIPNNNSDTPFTHFAVFYKIYVSDTSVGSTGSTTEFSAINQVLVSDYNSFSSYIDSTTLVSVDMEALFQGRGYKYLALDDHNISSVLSSSVFGETLVFDFPSSRRPTMSVGGNVYTLCRSDGGGLFTPQPDRYFVNKEELWRADNINDKINADVANKSGITADARHYTYAAMFIVAVGINVASYSNIFSTPSRIHVFQLTD
jgi:hypothetical protein